MSYNKKNEFNEYQINLAEFAKALSHPARIAILTQLAKKKTCICGEIVAVMPLAQSTVSQHLKELKNAGLINGEIDGPKSCYCINTGKLNDLANSFITLFGSLSGDCCSIKKGGDNE
ncbi:MAG: transcriptional regulator [Spirochaetes bacterium RBG_16_49_21]|nr:MAG: transcriptional regulator [Spirochaetes bacterium RBG_16_49_21]